MGWDGMGWDGMGWNDTIARRKLAEGTVVVVVVVVEGYDDGVSHVSS